MIIVDLGKDFEMQFKDACKANGRRIKDVVSERLSLWLNGSKSSGENYFIETVNLKVAQAKLLLEQIEKLSAEMIPEKNVKPTWLVNPDAFNGDDGGDNVSCDEDRSNVSNIVEVVERFKPEDVVSVKIGEKNFDDMSEDEKKEFILSQTDDDVW